MFSYLPLLEELDITYCDLEYLRKNPINNCKLLKRANLTLTSIEEVDKHSFEGLTNLEILNLKFNRCRKSTENIMLMSDILKSLTNLKEFKYDYFLQDYNANNKKKKFDAQQFFELHKISFFSPKLKKMDIFLENPKFVKKIFDELECLEELKFKYYKFNYELVSMTINRDDTLKLIELNIICNPYVKKECFNSETSLKERIAEYIADFSYGDLGSRNVASLLDLSNLKSLGLQNVHLKKNVFKNFKSLREFTLGDVKFENFTPRQVLSSLSELESLFMYSVNKLAGLDEGIFDNLKI